MGRAKLIRQLDENKNMVVIPKDSGRLVLLPSDSSVQPLWSQFGALPIGACSATLAGVKPLKEGGWDSRVIKWLRERLLQRDFVALVRGLRGKLMEVDLVDTSGEEEQGVNIQQQMVELNLAVWDHTSNRQSF